MLARPKQAPQYRSTLKQIALTPQQTPPETINIMRLIHGACRHGCRQGRPIGGNRRPHTYRRRMADPIAHSMRNPPRAGVQLRASTNAVRGDSELQSSVVFGASASAPS